MTPQVVLQPGPPHHSLFKELSRLFLILAAIKDSRLNAGGCRSMSGLVNDRIGQRAKSISRAVGAAERARFAGARLCRNIQPASSVFAFKVLRSSFVHTVTIL